MLQDSNHTDCWDCVYDEPFLTEFAIFLRNLLLIMSNFFLLPAVYLAFKCEYYAEAIIYFLTMCCSCFYHACDNERFQFCLFHFDILQFCDFYSAILTLWVTAILMSDLTYKWRSSLHLSGALFYAVLLRNETTGFWSFVVPGTISVSVLALSWGYHYFYENYLPSSLSYSNLIPGAVLSLIGAVLFVSQTTQYVQFYSYTHSGWHICMALAITFLLPKCVKNKDSSQEYSDHVCVLSIVSPDTY